MTDTFNLVNEYHYYANTLKSVNTFDYPNITDMLVFSSNSSGNAMKFFKQKENFLISDEKKVSSINIQSFDKNEDTYMKNITYEVYDSITKENLGIFKNISNDININDLYKNRKIDIKVIDNTNIYNGKYISNIDTSINYQKSMDIIQIYNNASDALYKIIYNGIPTFTLNGSGTLLKIDDNYFKVINSTNSYILTLVDYVDGVPYLIEKNYKKFPTWVLKNTETFDTSPTNKYRINWGSPNVTHDSLNSRLKISNGNNQGFISWLNFGEFIGDCAFEIDTTIISKNMANPHFGLFTSLNGNIYDGYRFATYDDRFHISYWVGGIEYQIGTFSNGLSFLVGSDYKFRIERINNVWSSYVNDIKLSSQFHTSVFNQIYAGFFSYGTEFYVNELRAYKYE